MGNRNKKGFTLAEVLITLAIIGVVAAMTIPTLLSNVTEKGWDTSASVFQRKLGEALQAMNTQQELTGLGSTENFVNVLKKHLKIINVCDNNNLQACFTDKIVWDGEEINMTDIKKSSTIGMEWDTDTNIVGIQTGSGVNALVAYNPDCKSNPFASSSEAPEGSMGSAINLKGSGKSVTLGVGGCLAVLYDVQGFSKPNEQNRDVRGIGGINFKSCKDIGSGVCIARVLQPGDYEPINCTDSNADGFEYCGNCNYFSSDYWAGAMRACGGKLPSGSQLRSIADYLYNGGNYEWSVRQATYDSSKAANIGLPSSGDFGVWASEDGSPGSNGAYHRWFSNNAADWDTNVRNAEYWAVCLK